MKATDPDGVASVNLEYQVVAAGDYIRIGDSRFSTEWTSIPMLDDGTNGDALAGDSIYTATVRADVHQHRQLMRYRVRATDQAGEIAVAPTADDPQPNFAYFVYDGIPSWTGADRPGRTESVTFGEDVMNQLATYHLIAETGPVQTPTGTGCVERLRHRRLNDK